MSFDIASIQEIINPKQGSDITYMDMVDEKGSLGESQIQKLFAGSTVLLTGGTGFLGKLLIEKLLRCCSDLSKIYILARPKKNKDTKNRLQEQCDDVLYDRLRKEQPDFINKIALIEGDVGMLDLGISDEDRKRIVNEVEIIFHGAATVRFDEPLKTAVQVNVRGTREMFLLARACTKLKALVHISTAYSNCPRREIGEQFYEPPLSGEKLIDLVENLDEKIIDKITPGLLGDYPNTYAYSKCAAEDIVRQYSKGLPVALFRPSIIIGTAKEPVSGWIDNVYGPTGVVVGAAVGLIHTLKCRRDNVADLVPGDHVVSGCVAAAWKVVRDFAANHEDAPPPDLSPTIYNYVSSVQNPLTWENFMTNMELTGLEVPTMQAMWHYVLMLTHSETMFYIYCLFMHWIPAYIVDAITTMLGRKPMLVKAYKKIDKFSEVISYFALREWKFSNSNTQRLYNELCDADKHMFDFDISSLNWFDYSIGFTRGIRVYLLKDPMETVTAGTRKHNILKYCHYTFVTIILLLSIRLLYGLISFAINW